MKLKFTTLMSTLSIVGGLITAGDSHYRSQYSDPEKLAQRLEKHLLDALDQVGVSGPQDRRIRSIARSISQDGVWTQERFSASRGVMAAELFSDRPNLDALHRLATEKSAAVTEFSHRTIDRLAEINALLTPGQLAALRRRFDQAQDSC